MTAPRTKREIAEAEDGLRYHHPLSEWLRHGDHCPARRLSMDTRNLEGPCNCGLNDALRSAPSLDEGLRAALIALTNADQRRPIGDFIWLINGALEEGETQP